jgi:hypothetical protein
VYEDEKDTTYSGHGHQIEAQDESEEKRAFGERRTPDSTVTASNPNDVTGRVVIVQKSHRTHTYYIFKMLWTEYAHHYCHDGRLTLYQWQDEPGDSLDMCAHC